MRVSIPCSALVLLLWACSSDGGAKSESAASTPETRVPPAPRSGSAFDTGGTTGATDAGNPRGADASPPPTPGEIATCTSEGAQIAACPNAIQCVCNSCAPIMLECERNPDCLYIASCTVQTNCYDTGCFFTLPDLHPDICKDLLLHTSALAQIQTVGACLLKTLCPVAECVQKDSGSP